MTPDVHQRFILASQSCELTSAQRMSQAIALIRETCDKPLYITRLAKKCGINA